MATRSSGKPSTARRSSTSTARRSSSSGRKPAGSRQTSSSRRAVPVQENRGIIETIIRSPILSRLAMPIIFIAVVLVIVGIDLLISWNDFSGFFKILGVELLAAVIVWILKMVFSKSKTSDDSDGRNVSEV